MFATPELNEPKISAKSVNSFARGESSSTGYEAVDLSLDRKVFLKIPTASAASSRKRPASLLDHPNIVSICDANRLQPCAKSPVIATPLKRSRA